MLILFFPEKKNVLHVNVTGIMKRELSQMEHFEIQNNPENICWSLRHKR